jgi:hypothetical protein
VFARAQVCFGCGAVIGSRVQNGADGGGRNSGDMRARTTADKTPIRFTTFNDLSLCARCDSLNHDAYDDARSALADVDEKVFENQLVQLKFKRVLIVLVVDATDPLGSMIAW